MTQSISIRVTVNEKEYKREVEPRLLLSDFLRHELGLTGTHVGCEHGVCGACTILFEDRVGEIMFNVCGAGKWSQYYNRGGFGQR